MLVILDCIVASTEIHISTFLMGVPVLIALVASLVDQHVIQNATVTLGNIPQLLAEVRQVLHVIPVHFGIVGDILRLVAMVRRSMPPSSKAGFGEAGAGEVAA